ncbi:MAG: DUF4163 domain-containing protein [Candidatus Kapabacteria bacterium]|nr:DUF4163 domain-containing protein [Candidatus Kapabacteria bacterium]
MKNLILAAFLLPLVVFCYLKSTIIPEQKKIEMKSISTKIIKDKVNRVTIKTDLTEKPKKNYFNKALLKRIQKAYLKGDVEFQFWNYTQLIPRATDSTNKIDITYPEIINFKDSMIQNMINKKLINKRIRKETNELMELVIEDNEYRDSNNIPSAEYHFKEYCEIEYNQNNFLSINKYWDDYSGGAHENYYLESMNFDLETGKRFNISHSIKDTTDPKLLKLILKRLDKFNQCTKEIDQIFNISENIYIKDGQIIFCYDVYSLWGFYCLFMESSLSFKEIEPFIKKRSPLYRLISKNNS